MIKEPRQGVDCKVLTPMGRLQGEAHRSPCRQIQAASLIFEGLQATLRSHTSDRVPVAAHDSC